MFSSSNVYPPFLSLLILFAPSFDASAEDGDFTFDNPHFEAPILITEGTEWLNAKVKQMYPSPAIFDVDQDGTNELIVGDIFGSLMVYKNQSKSGMPVWTHVGPLKNHEGKDIRVSNW